MPSTSAFAPTMGSFADARCSVLGYHRQDPGACHSLTWLTHAACNTSCYLRLQHIDSCHKILNLHLVGTQSTNASSLPSKRALLVHR
jgi:hypothetical protein